VLSGLGLFSLVFGFIEAQKYGWWHAKEVFKFGAATLSIGNLSVVPLAFLLAVVLLVWFIIHELNLERAGRSPILRLSMFSHRGFSFGLATLAIISMGQFGVFFILPIFLQNVLGLTALKTGLVFLSTSLAVMVTGPLSGIIASKINPKNVITAGMVFSVIGTFWLAQSLRVDATGWTLAPALIFFGIGLGATSAQLTNLILSDVPIEQAGEASAVNSAIRQIGTSIGIAVLGTVLATTLITHVSDNIRSDRHIPASAKNQIISNISSGQLEGGQTPNIQAGDDLLVTLSVKNDINNSLAQSARAALYTATAFVVLGLICSFLVPDAKVRPNSADQN
jgi:nitrate/nitrite transporter NarK